MAQCETDPLDWLVPGFTLLDNSHRDPPPDWVPTPAPSGWAEAFRATESDPPPPKLAANVSFPTSNERFLYVWADSVRNLHGAYIGVGTDQNYVLAGWAKPELLVLMDFDQTVVDVHACNRVLFLSAETPKEFLALFAFKALPKCRALFERHLSDPVEREHLWKVFQAERRPIELRYHQLLEDLQAQKISFFLNDPEQYTYLAGLFRSDRVLLVRGDLTGPKALRSIGRLTRRLQQPVRLLYLSNAERYFYFTVDYKKNVLSLPFDKRSLVLRTYGFSSWDKGDPFVYLLQSGADFIDWLREAQVIDVQQLLKKRRHCRDPYLYLVGGPTTPLPPGPPKNDQKKLGVRPNDSPVTDQDEERP